ncbi:MAG: ATP-binding protein [Clostridiales bacterium]|nr:ATP-binding protein [Clostridiales bacterium]
MQESAETEQLKNEFQLSLSKFSHEIRNPLTLISSSLQMMAAEHPEVENFRQWDDITNNMEYICELIDDLSVYNNADTITVKETDLPEYINSVLSSVRPTLDYLGITLKTDLSASLPPVMLDQVKMRQALLNLLQNAWESIPVQRRGEIRVRAFSQGGSICISIEDNGSGIPAEQKSDIFQPFYSTKPSGTGLGLAVVSQIIRAHHGSIRIFDLPERGTAFQILL